MRAAPLLLLLLLSAPLAGAATSSAALTMCTSMWSTRTETECLTHAGGAVQELGGRCATLPPLLLLPVGVLLLAVVLLAVLVLVVMLLLVLLPASRPRRLAADLSSHSALLSYTVSQCQAMCTNEVDLLGHMCLAVSVSGCVSGALSSPAAARGFAML